MGWSDKYSLDLLLCRSCWILSDWESGEGCLFCG